MLDHVSLRVQDFSRALTFYKAALAPIGYQVTMEYPGGAGLGEPGKPDLWITATDKIVLPTHIAFRTDRAPHQVMHFGYGDHVCLGKYVGMAIIPEVVRRVLLRPNARLIPGQEGAIDFQGGPFPERFLVAYGAA